ncbi:MAG: hypothetical protein ABI898_08460 [Sphingomonadales bacterium]
MLSAIFALLFVSASSQSAPLDSHDIVIDDGLPRCASGRSRLQNPPLSAYRQTTGIIEVNKQFGLQLRPSKLPAERRLSRLPSQIMQDGVASSIFGDAEQYVQALSLPSSVDPNAEYFAIEFDGRHQIFSDRYLKFAEACTPGWTQRVRTKQGPLYMIRSISRLSRCQNNDPLGCTLSNNSLISERDKLDEQTEFNGIAMRAGGNLFFLMDGVATQPYLLAPDRIQMVESKVGVFSVFSDAANRLSKDFWRDRQMGPQSFRVRFQGRRSPYLGSGPRVRALKGKLVVDRIIEVEACRFRGGFEDCQPVPR